MILCFFNLLTDPPKFDPIITGKAGGIISINIPHNKKIISALFISAYTNNL